MGTEVIFDKRVKLLTDGGYEGEYTVGLVYPAVRCSLGYYVFHPKYEGGLYFYDHEVELIEDISSEGGSTSYYKLPAGATDLADLIEYKKMNFNRGNIFKAAYRLGEKDAATEVYDLNKIIWFAQREIKRIARESE